MRPLDMPEIFVVKGFGQRDTAVFEGVDRIVFAVEERAVVFYFRKRLARQASGADRRVNGVFRIVYRTFFIKMGAGEIERRMAERAFGDARVFFDNGTENGNRLRVRSAV